MKNKVLTHEDLSTSAQYLEQHYFSNGKLQGAYYEELINMMPQCQFSGDAYRAIFVDGFNQVPNFSLLNKNYSSWSSSLDGVKKFIEHRLSDADAENLINKKIIIFQTSIVYGFDVLKAIDILVKNEYYPAKARNKWAEESEIISFENSNTIEIKRINSVNELF